VLRHWSTQVKTARCVSRSINRRVREIVEWSAGGASKATPRKSRNANESAARQAMPRSDARWQARPTHLRIKTGALGFREVIEDVFAQQLIQAPIKRVTRGCR
jgi:hypothetical protein